MRASIYNSMPVNGVQQLVDFMKVRLFERKLPPDLQLYGSLLVSMVNSSTSKSLQRDVEVSF